MATYDDEVARSKKLTYAEGFYWGRALISKKCPACQTKGCEACGGTGWVTPEPEILYFEPDAHGGGRFRDRIGQWGTDYSWEILKGPLVYDG